jgi:Holliday junction resolvase
MPYHAARHQSVWERELKEILAGKEEAIKGICVGLTDEERGGYESALAMKFVTVRAGGSLGLDLVALRGEFSFPFEIKASKDSEIRLHRNARLKAQKEELLRLCREARVIPLYAYRRKGLRGEDPWKLYTMSVGNAPARLSLIQSRVPVVMETRTGAPVLRWNEGLKLSKFLEYLHHLQTD